MVRLSVFILLCQTISLAEEVLVDRIVAISGSTPILHSTIQSRVKAQRHVALSHYPAVQGDKIDQKILHDEINTQLVKRKLESLDITVTDDDVSQEISRFLTSRNLNMAGLRQALVEQGLSYEEYYEDFRNRILFSRFQGRIIWPRLNITERALQAYYAKTQGSVSRSVLTLRRIRIDTARYGKEKSNKVLERLKENPDFDAAAKLYSDDPYTAKNGGLMPVVAFQNLSQDLQRVIADLQVGDLSQLVTLSDGDYIFKLENKSFSDESGFAKARKEIEAELIAIESEKQTQRWIQDERKRVKTVVIP